MFNPNVCAPVPLKLIADVPALHDADVDKFDQLPPTDNVLVFMTKYDAARAIVKAPEQLRVQLLQVRNPPVLGPMYIPPTA